MLRLFLVFLSLRLSFSLPVALLPPHRAVSSCSVSPGRQGGNRCSVSLSGKSPPPQSAWTTRRLRLHLIDADVYVGTASWGGEVLFRFASLSSFPLILFCSAACATIACNCTGGVLALCKPPFGQCHCTIEMRGVIPLENPVFTPPSVASLRRDGELGRGGSFSFRPLCLLFPLFYICLAACAAIVCNCTRGV